MYSCLLPFWHYDKKKTGVRELLPCLTAQMTMTSGQFNWNVFIYNFEQECSKKTQFKMKENQLASLLILNFGA